MEYVWHIGLFIPDVWCFLGFLQKKTCRLFAGLNKTCYLCNAIQKSLWWGDRKEVWVSGWNHQFAKLTCGFTVPGVRIPQLPLNYWTEMDSDRTKTRKSMICGSFFRFVQYALTLHMAGTSTCKNNGITFFGLKILILHWGSRKTCEKQQLRLVGELAQRAWGVSHPWAHS